jgi:class 3 adenylate cyclase
MVCTNCGRENAGDSRFCSRCGSPLGFSLPAREERKVVTVLFCDLVDFTTRAELLDPEDVRAIQAPYYERLRDELEHHGGTVEKFIGDAVMALFGAPVAHEDDPERAVRAALAIRDWVAEQGKLQVRLAITTGEALVHLEAQPLTGQGMASGDVVNTAARLQVAAPENGVLVDETTYRATNEVIDYRRVEPIEAKGKAKPVAVWEAEHARLPIRPIREPRAPFVGRGRELAVLWDTFAGVLSEASIRLVTLIGVPGIGKSRLIYELRTAVERDGASVSWLQGRSLPYGAGVTLWALGEIVKSHASILESDGAAEADEKLRTAVAGAVGEATDADWVHAHLRPLVMPANESEAGWDGRAEAFAAWRHYFEALAAQRPLVLVLEDVHWADDTLLDFVEYLVDWATEVPLLVLATARPELLERRPAWAGSKPDARTLVLAPLSEEEATQLLAALLDRPLLDAETQATLLAQAAGNPLYAEEYVRLLSGSEGDAAPATAPETVQGIIAARIDELSVEEKALLQDAAVVGKVFWSGVVGVMAASDRWAVETRLLALERRELLRRERRSAVEGETQYAFHHELICDVAYGEIPHWQRSDKHLRAAEWIQSLGRPEDHAELLAHHYVSALGYAHAADKAKAELATRARLALRDAGDRALGLNALSSAARFYEAALELWPEDDLERPELLFRYGSSLRLTERGEPLLQAAYEALLGGGQKDSAAEAQLMLSNLAWLAGDPHRCLEHLERAADLLADAQASQSKAYLLSQVSRFRMLTGDDETALRVGAEALAMAEELGLDEVRANALDTIGVLRVGTGDEGGIEDIERSISIALAANSAECVRGYSNLAGSWYQLGQVRRGSEVDEEALRAAERFGDEIGRRFLRGHRLFASCLLGRWEECIALADEFIAESEAGLSHYHEPLARCTRAFVRLARDDSAGTVEDARRGLEAVRHVKDPQTSENLLGVTALTLHEAGQVEQAEALAEELLEMSSGGKRPRLHEGLPVVWLFLKLGLQEDLLTALERARPTAWRVAARAATAGDFAVAADSYEAIGSRPDEAYARLFATQFLFNAGRHDEASEQVEKALVFYRSVGATRFVREAESLLSITA